MQNHLHGKKRRKDKKTQTRDALHKDSGSKFSMEDTNFLAKKINVIRVCFMYLFTQHVFSFLWLCV